MKKVILLIVTAFFTYHSYSQCDNAFFPFKEGVSFEMTSYSSKDKEQGKTISTIPEGAIKGSSVTVSNKTFDDNGKVVAEGAFEVVCEDGNIKMDMKQFVPAQLLEQYENMDVTMEGDFLQFPSELSVGQKLPDGSGVMTMKMAQGAMSMNMTMDMKFVERMVEKKETLTTPAGTFETFKISQKTITTLKMMGMNQETTMKSISWCAKGVGSVRTEAYDKNDKLLSYTLLTSFSE